MRRDESLLRRSRSPCSPCSSGRGIRARGHGSPDRRARRHDQVDGAAGADPRRDADARSRRHAHDVRVASGQAAPDEPEHDALRRAVAAHRTGVRIVLGVYGRAVDAPREPAAREDYCRFVRNVVLRYGEIRDVVIWNEANSDTFWQPQEGAPAAYAALLARCWDVLHASVPGVNVLTTTASSHDPAAFIRGIGAAYRASGRAAAALRRRRPQPVSALSRRASDRPPRRLHRPGRLRPARGGPRRVLRRHGAAGRRRSGTSRTASRRPSANRRRSHYTGRENVARTLDAGRAGGAARDRAPARELPAARRRVLQLPPRRRVAARRLAVRPALGRLAAQAGVRRLSRGDRRGPARRGRLRRRSALADAGAGACTRVPGTVPYGHGG